MARKKNSLDTDISVVVEGEETQSEMSTVKEEPDKDSTAVKAIGVDHFPDVTKKDEKKNEEKSKNRLKVCIA